MQDVTRLSKDITSYEKLVQFQWNLMEHLYDEPIRLFRLICDYMECANSALLLCDLSGIVQSYCYDRKKDELTKRKQNLDAPLVKLFRKEKIKYFEEEEIPEGVNAYAGQWGVKEFAAYSFFNGEVNHSLYSVILYHEKKKEPDVVYGLEKFLLSNIQVCVENRMYYESMAYESQYDILTKLYNRRSYFRRSREEYPLLDSIGVLYFDVNNLKKINDCYGHDAGDALIQKAAESIRCLTSDMVHGYRMGGDEFIVVAMNCTQEELNEMLNRWEKELQRINAKGGEPCIIAVGAAYAGEGFEIEEVCQLADKRMYRDKKLKKRAVGY